MKESSGKHAGESWHKVGLMWFVVGLPATVVVAALITVGIAVKSSDDVVRDDFRKEGLAIYADPSRDAAAAALGANVLLTVDAAEGRLHATLTLARGEAPDSLVVLLSHATRAELDRLVTLRARGGVYEGRTDPLPPGHWYVEITPPGRQWRLKGDFRDAAAGISLEAPGVS